MEAGRARRRAALLLIAASVAACGGSAPRPTITGLTDIVAHLHGGEPAIVADARWRIENPGDAPVVLRVDAAWLLWRPCLRQEAWRVAARLRPTTSSLRAAPGQSEHVVSFEPEDVYQGCEDHAIRVRFVIAGQRVVADAPLEVWRGDP